MNSKKKISPLIYFCIITLIVVITPLDSFSKETASVLVTKMMETFDGLVNYSALITTFEKESKTKMRYFYQKPGYTKMVFIEPHEGATLSYNPNTGRVVLRPFKSLRSVSMSLAPENSLIQSPRGHSIDKSDIGCFLRTMTELHKNGKAKIISGAIEYPSEKIIFEVTGSNDFSIDKINKYKVEFNSGLYFPTEVKAYSSDGELIEHMKLADVKIDQSFSSDTFDY